MDLFSTFRLDFQNYALAIAFFLNLILSAVILTSSNKKKEELSFSLLALGVALWALGMFMYRGVLNDGITLIWAKYYYVFAGIIPSAFLYFALNYPIKQIGLRRSFKYVLTIMAIIFIVSPLFSDFIVQTVTVQSFGENRISFGVGLLAWGFYTSSYFIFAFYFLFRQFILTSVNSVLKNQYRLILTGSLISVLIGLTTNHILPLFFNNPDYAWVGPTAALIMTTFITIAIYKFHLFNAKLVITEVLIFFVWLALLVNLLLSKSASTFVPNTFVLFVVVILGIFVIRSVIKEVHQREKIELLATDLQKANDRLTELDRQKSEFVSFATHQLRAPLTAMKGYASLILEGDMGTITDATKEAITRIFDSSKTLANIVDDYLNITRIELGSMKYAFETISLKALIEDVIAELKPNIEKSKLEFLFKSDTPEANYRITADRDKLKQVIANLIDNSIKYTPSGWVHVALNMDRLRHKFVFKVEDSGIGIAPETIPLLFQKFGRAHNANKVNIKGTGLGLFVAKEILNAHNATIHVESEGEGKGSSFIVEFEPFAKA
jgi:signal transduction histidine kinase